MEGIRYKKTFIHIDEAPEASEGRSKSSPPMRHDSDLQRLEWKKAHMSRLAIKLEERSRLLRQGPVHRRRQTENTTRQPVSSSSFPSQGSYGHPVLCRRPCYLFSRNSCLRGSECGFCHLPHEARLPSLDAQQRQFLKDLSELKFLLLLLPHIERQIEELELYEAKELLELFRRA